ncbi:MAG: hypothetical protein WC783_00310 [Candidatus Paceibacterota bacterium]|jgi:hypothetical protein
MKSLFEQLKKIGQTKLTEDDIRIICDDLHFHILKDLYGNNHNLFSLLANWLSYIKWEQNEINKDGIWSLGRDGDTCALCQVYGHNFSCRGCVLKCNIFKTSAWKKTSAYHKPKPSKNDLVTQLERALEKKCASYGGNKQELIKKAKEILEKKRFLI